MLTGFSFAGRRYGYRYEAQTKTGIPSTSRDASGVTLTATVWLTMSESKDFAEIAVQSNVLCGCGWVVYHVICL